MLTYVRTILPTMLAHVLIELNKCTHVLCRHACTQLRTSLLVHLIYSQFSAEGLGMGMDMAIAARAPV